MILTLVVPVSELPCEPILRGCHVLFAINLLEDFKTTGCGQNQGGVVGTPFFHLKEWAFEMPAEQMGSIPAPLGGGDEVILGMMTSLESTDRIVQDDNKSAITVPAHDQGRNETGGGSLLARETNIIGECNGRRTR